MKQFDKGIKEVRPHRILLFSEAFDCPITNQDRQSLTLNVYRVTIIQAQGSTSSTCPRYLFGEVVEVSLNGFKYGMHFQIMSAIALIANALQKYKKQMKICHLRTDIFEKTSFRQSNGIKNGRKQPTNCPFSSAWRKKQCHFHQGERKERIVA